MTGSGTLGSAGNVADLVNRNYPAVPFSAEHFNTRCNIYNWNDPYQIRDCEVNFREKNILNLKILIKKSTASWTSRFKSSQRARTNNDC